MLAQAKFAVNRGQTISVARSGGEGYID